MASYPGAVKTFASRSAGQTIDASHVGDLQDEVNAIEDGLLNGTAPLNSSKSTVASLSVAGASTFAGEVTMLVAPAHARVASTAVTDVAHDTRTFLNFTTQRAISTASMHSTVTDSSQVKVHSSGLYLITGHVEWKAFSTAGRRQVELWLNDTTALAIQNVPALPVAAVLQQSVATVHYATSTGDFVGLAVYQDSGSTGSLSTVAQYSADLTLTKIR